MGVLPVFLVLVLSGMDPVFMGPLFTTTAGWAVLGAAVLLETLGFLWIRAILRMEA